MLLQFKVAADDTLWQLDTDMLIYLRIGAEDTEELGKLAVVYPIGEIYRLVGRETTTDGPGCGLTSIAILPRVLKTGVFIGINANVLVKDACCIQPFGIPCEVLGQSAGLPSEKQDAG